jgi:hypothetical protein
MKQRTLILLFAFILIVPILASAQNLVLDDYSHSGSKYLNNLVAADSTSAAFVAGTRVYVLRKDGQYFFNAAMTTYQGKPMVFTIDPADTGYAGARLNPECYGVLSSAKKLPGNFIQMQNGGKVELHNINISGYRCGDAGGSDSLIGYQQGALVSIGTAGGIGRIIIDKCVLHGVNGNHIRTDGVTDTVIVTNTIFGDMGNISPSNYGAGKGLDLRDVDIVYCKIQNCTFVNAQDRIVRHFQSKNPIHNFIFDHNTVVNCMGYHGFLSLGKVDSTGIGTLQITNNLLVDHFALGADTAYIRQVEFSDPGELDPLNNQPRMVWVMTNKNNAAVWKIQNNYYAITNAGAEVRALKEADGYIPRADTTKEDPFLTWNMNKVLASQGKDTNATFTKIKVEMTTVPPLMSTMIKWVYTPRTSYTIISGTYTNPNYGGTGIGVTIPYSLPTYGDGKQKNSGDANFKATLIPSLSGIFGLDYNRRSLEWYSYYSFEGLLGVGNVLNCSYKASSNLQTAGTDGKVIGDTRWSWKGYIAGLSAAFNASAASIDFGTVNTNKTKKDSIVVTNPGTIDLTITAVNSSNPVFTVTPTSATVGAGAAQKFYVTFAPTANGTQHGKITFIDNASTQDSITVVGNGNLVSVQNLANAIPQEYQLHENYPNPFNPSTTIQYDLPKQSVVTLKVYSMLGQVVATLVNSSQAAGYHQTVWTGKNDGGNLVSSGVYIIRMSAKADGSGNDAFTQVRKMLMLK